MTIVFFVHPTFLDSQSMPKFASMLSEGMAKRGHTIEVWSPQSFFFRLPLAKSFRKWLGYLDQYLVFPIGVKLRFMRGKGEKLFVFSDQALGPWVHLVAKSPHVIHCHDFLAQRSALGEIPQNKVTWTGKRYQAYIRKGFRQGKNFISVSQNTKNDLHRFLTTTPQISEVVYNGLNQSFNPGDSAGARILLTRQCGVELTSGYLLHVGGNQWYKNRKGIVEIYNALRLNNSTSLPLLLIGKNPDAELSEMIASSNFKDDIHCLSNINDDTIKQAYIGASIFLFPSLAEGFGWPIAEAMASGCLVVTTNEAPMTEVAGDAAFLIPPRPPGKETAKAWAQEAAEVVAGAIRLSETERMSAVNAGLENAKRFNTQQSLENIEAIYKDILQSYKIQ
ncbi:MAG: glycosyltransferase [Ferruginibacter sp.]